MNERRRVLIVCGVAGGASAAARLRRLDEAAEIVIFDRGPYVYGRDLDVTVAVADQIGLTYAGVGLVTWWVE